MHGTKKLCDTIMECLKDVNTYTWCAHP